MHMAQLMPLPLTVSWFSKIQIGFTFLVPAHLGSPGKRAVKRVCVCVCSYIRREVDVVTCLQHGGGVSVGEDVLDVSSAVEMRCIDIHQQQSHAIVLCGTQI